MEPGVDLPRPVAPGAMAAEDADDERPEGEARDGAGGDRQAARRSHRDDRGGHDDDGVCEQAQRQPDGEAEVRAEVEPGRAVRKQGHAPEKRPADGRSACGTHREREDGSDPRQAERDREHDPLAPATPPHERPYCKSRTERDENDGRDGNRPPPRGEQLAHRRVVAVRVSRPGVVLVARKARQRVPAIRQRGERHRNANRDAQRERREEPPRRGDAEQPQRRSLFDSMSNHIANSVNCEPEIRSSATSTIVAGVIGLPSSRSTVSTIPSTRPVTPIRKPRK